MFLFGLRQADLCAHPAEQAGLLPSAAIPRDLRRLRSDVVLPVAVVLGQFWFNMDALQWFQFSFLAFPGVIWRPYVLSGEVPVPLVWGRIFS